MERAEEQINENYAKQCLHCNRNTLLPYEYLRFMWLQCY